MSNYWVFGAHQSLNSYFAAMSRHQGSFVYFSAGPGGPPSPAKRGTAQIPQNGWEFTFSDTIVIFRDDWPEMSGPQR